MYKNCQVEITCGNVSTIIDYTAGVYRGSNMSPIFFPLIMQAFLGTKELNVQWPEFFFFPENKNGNLQTLKGRLLNQNTSAKRKTFGFRDALYVDDSMFLFYTQNELEEAASKLQE